MVGILRVGTNMAHILRGGYVDVLACVSHPGQGKLAVDSAQFLGICRARAGRNDS
jgi:hypothetical protein